MISDAIKSMETTMGIKYHTLTRKQGMHQTDKDDYRLSTTMSTHSKRKESDGRLTGWSPLVAGIALEIWGISMLLAIVQGYTVLGDTLPFGWQVVVGGVTTVAGILLVGRTRWGRPAGLLAVALIIAGNVYFLFSFRTGASPIAIIIAAILGYVITTCK
jgi:hypothetical protein